MKGGLFSKSGNHHSKGESLFFKGIGFYGSKLLQKTRENFAGPFFGKK